MINSTATYPTWRGMGPVRLYLARDSPYDDGKQTYHTGSVAAHVNNIHVHQDRGIKYATGASLKICGKTQTLP